MSENEIVVYHYPYSPFARRVLWYLTLRDIDYSQCVQPPIMPRPDLEAIGVSYRRIPVLALGRDIIVDTRLQLQALDAYVAPSQTHPSIAVHGAEAETIAMLFSKWQIEGGLFTRGAQLLPPDLPLLKDPKFTKDRESLSGRSWQKDDLQRGRPEAIIYVRQAFDILENLLGDDREWICKTASPSIADIEAVWMPLWLKEVKGMLDENFVSAKLHPKTFAWIERFAKVVKAKQAAKKPTTLNGENAAKVVLQAGYVRSVALDEVDPLDFKGGEMVQVWPTDSGSSHRDSGKLVGLNKQEIVIESMAGKSKDGKDIRMHFPRTMFRVQEKGQSNL